MPVTTGLHGFFPKKILAFLSGISLSHGVPPGRFAEEALVLPGELGGTGVAHRVGRVLHVELPREEQAPRVSSSAQLPPYVLRPVAYDDVQTVVRRVRTNQPVVLVFKQTDLEVAKRILDFCFGLSFGINGSVEELGDRVFAVCPHGVEVTSNDLDMLAREGIIAK